MNDRIDASLAVNQSPESLLSFEDAGMDIRNPFLSDCGRFEVDPREAYGFSDVSQESGKKGWSRTHPDGGFILLSNDSGDGEASLQDTGNARITRVDAQGNVVATCLVSEVKFEV